MIVHLIRPNAANPKRSDRVRLCDGGPLVDVPDPLAAIKAWKAGGYKVGDSAAIDPQWTSCNDPHSTTCPACRAHPAFAGHLAGIAPAGEVCLPPEA